MNNSGTMVSFYTHFSDTKAPINATFLQVVNSQKLADKYADLLFQIRATDNKTERDKLKKTLPCFTPSGTFSRRAADGLLSHSGLIQFDIDPGQNPWLNAQTASALRTEISKLKQVYYCALSASGKGVWGVVPIEQPEQHKEHFEALKADFAGWSIVIDPACSNVDRLRFWSHDPAAYINQDATTYTKIFTPTHNTTTRQNGQRWDNERPQDLAQQAAAYLIQNRVPLECTYSNFMRIAFACKHEWGEAGKGIALDILHACTTFAQSNTARNFDSIWRNIKRDGGNVTTGGTLVNMAKERGYRYQPTNPYPTAQQPPTADPLKLPTIAPPSPIAAPTVNAGLPKGYRRECLTDRETGRPIEVLLNADGYPAGWDKDLEPQQKESIARLIQAQPDTTEMIVRFGLKYDKVEAAKPWEQWQTESKERYDRARRWYPKAFGIEPTPQPAHILRKVARRATL